MKRYSVTFRSEAEGDLSNLYDYIAENGGRLIAERYVERIEPACLSLSNEYCETGAARAFADVTQNAEC